MLIGDVLNRYVASKPGLKQSSANQLQYSVNAFRRFAGRFDLRDVTDDFLVLFVRSRMRRCAPSTVARNIKDITLLLRFAIKRMGLEILPPDIEAVAIPRPIPTAWTIEELERIISVCRKLTGNMRNSRVSRADWWLALLLFLYDSGARIQAALSLSPRDFYAENGYAVLRGEHAKTGLEQVVDLGPETVEAMQRVIAGNDRGSPIFHYPWSIRKIWKDFHEVLDAAGMTDSRYIGFHRLRKTHATQQVIAHGWDQARVALGHSSESMTRRYVDIRQIPRLPSKIQRPKIS